MQTFYSFETGPDQIGFQWVGSSFTHYIKKSLPLFCKLKGVVWVWSKLAGLLCECVLHNFDLIIKKFNYQRHLFAALKKFTSVHLCP